MKNGLVHLIRMGKSIRQMWVNNVNLTLMILLCHTMIKPCGRWFQFSHDNSIMFLHDHRSRQLKESTELYRLVRLHSSQLFVSLSLSFSVMATWRHGEVLNTASFRKYYSLLPCIRQWISASAIRSPHAHTHTYIPKRVRTHGLI